MHARAEPALQAATMTHESRTRRIEVPLPDGKWWRLGLAAGRRRRARIQFQQLLYVVDPLWVEPALLGDEVLGLLFRAAQHEAQDRPLDDGRVMALLAEQRQDPVRLRPLVPAPQVLNG